MGQERKWAFSSEGRWKRTELRRRGLPLSLSEIWREDSCSHIAKLDSQIPTFYIPTCPSLYIHRREGNSLESHLLLQCHYSQEDCAISSYRASAESPVNVIRKAENCENCILSPFWMPEVLKKNVDRPHPSADCRTIRSSVFLASGAARDACLFFRL